MPRLKNTHTGVVVSVDDALASRLRGAGWKDAGKKASAKKPTSSKSEK